MLLPTLLLLAASSAKPRIAYVALDYGLRDHGDPSPCKVFVCDNDGKHEQVVGTAIPYVSQMKWLDDNHLEVTTPLSGVRGEVRTTFDIKQHQVISTKRVEFSEEDFFKRMGSPERVNGWTVQRLIDRSYQMSLEGKSLKFRASEGRCYVNDALLASEVWDGMWIYQGPGQKGLYLWLGTQTPDSQTESADLLSFDSAVGTWKPVFKSVGPHSFSGKRAELFYAAKGMSNTGNSEGSLNTLMVGNLKTGATRCVITRPVWIVQVAVEH